MTEYYIPTGRSQAELVEKRSRFIGQVWRVSSEEEARARIEETKKKHYDARHNCWCYRVREGGVERYSDDGEPQGTAGQPMLNVFQRENVTDAVCVVTRYFGGILLGAGGLVRAYTQSAKNALDAAGISVVRRWVEALLSCPYSWHDRVRQEVERLGGTIAGTDYGADVCFTALLPEQSAQEILASIYDLSAGQIEGLVSGERFQDVPWRQSVL